MKKLLMISMMSCILLTSCMGQGSIATAFPSPAQEPSSTAIPTFTLTSTLTRIPSTERPSTPTFTPFPPYHTKKVVFEYYILGQHSYFDIFYVDYSEIPNIILYEDGQMLIGGKQKVLSADELERFLSKLDTLGLFSIESNQQFDPTDKLYDFGSNYQEVNDGLKYCVLVNTERLINLCVQEDYMQYLIPEMKSIIKYLDEYNPTGLTRYEPDRILLSIEPVNSTSEAWSASATPWDKRFPSLDVSHLAKSIDGPPASILYFEGEIAKEIYTFLKNSPSQDVFIQDDKKYIVQVDIVLPHQTVINAYQ